MQHKIRNTIKMRISLITVSFSLVIAVFLSTLSFRFFQDSARRSVIQSTEFNLQLVAGVLGQKLTELDMLSRWCVTSTQIADWLTEEPLRMQHSIEVYDRLKEVIWNNRSNGYIRRLIVTDKAVSRILQAGLTMSESLPVTVYNLPSLQLSGTENARVYRSCTDDPYALGKQTQVLPVIRPIRRIGSQDSIGYVYLAISVDVLLDQLVNYHMASDSSLFLWLGDAVYRLEGSVFTDITDRIVSVSEHQEKTLSRNTVLREIRTGREGKSILVTCPAGVEGAFLSQSLSSVQIAGERKLYMIILALISVTMIVFGVFMSLLLSRLITRPVFSLRKKIDAIAGSDFKNEPGIEWDNELGDIGRGINDMAMKIESLLETRLADEKNKRDLEYRMLQSQINPHFLYNTLNSIKWMATIQNATGIAEMTTALSRLMKNAVKGSRTVVCLAEEISLLDDYFLIQHYRYGGAVLFEKAVPEDLLDVPVPCFSLQPLLENAIFHGIEPKGGTGKITLSACRVSPDTVEIIMEDDGIGMSEEHIRAVLSPAEPGASAGLFREIGIASVAKRLRYSFGDEYGLRLESVSGAYTRAILRVPLSAVGVPERPVSVE